MIYERVTSGTEREREKERERKKREREKERERERDRLARRKDAVGKSEIED